MNRRRLQLAVLLASVALVFTAAAVSRSDRWNFDFAQYKGPDRPEPKDEFRFVMVGDRTGGRVPGLMPQAFREINNLYPDFVICVGDLIDGAAPNDERTNQLWKEFDDEVALLKSPFVYLPGNHDIWNADSHGIYVQRYGPAYRSFDYRGLHFITLNTEVDEDGKKIDRIDGKQLEWLKEDIARNRKAKAILVLMHKPIWQQGGLDEAEKVWNGLPVHVFAGHLHRYSYEMIDGIPHIILGAVAGVMREEGDAIGRFRHYVLATVCDGELKLALIRLGGVLPPDVVFDSDISRVSQLADACALYCEGADDSGDVRLVCRNPFDQELKLQIQKTTLTSGKFSAQPLFRDAALSLEAKGALDKSLGATTGGSPTGVAAEFKAVYEFANSQGQTQKIDFPVEPRRRRTVEVKPRASAPTIDGDLSDWSDADWQTLAEPRQVFSRTNAWKGPDDLSAKFALAQDEQNIYIAVRVTDDVVAFNSWVADADGIELYMARPAKCEFSFARDPDWRRLFVAPFAADGNSEGDPSGPAYTNSSGASGLKSVKAAYMRESKGYTIELAISRQELGWTGGADANCQFDLVINDRDLGYRRESQLVWSGTERDQFSSRYYGRVRLANP